MSFKSRTRFRLFDVMPATSDTPNDKSILYQDVVSTKARASAVFGGLANEALLDANAFYSP